MTCSEASSNLDSCITCAVLCYMSDLYALSGVKKEAGHGDHFVSMSGVKFPVCWTRMANLIM